MRLFKFPLDEVRKVFYGLFLGELILIEKDFFMDCFEVSRVGNFAKVFR
ncbi:hypothetical protein SAMN04488084_108100 [Pedobacter antarcticus]|nr:hypothetical protein SAMN04488084_108100 [Pedobacter antarcticus]